MIDRPGVPCLGLTGFGPGERCLAGWGAGLLAVDHTKDNAAPLKVEVWSRLTYRAIDGRKLPIEEEDALAHVARDALLASGAVDPDVIFPVPKATAADRSAWRLVQISIEGREDAALECELEGYFVLVYLTMELIIGVIGPAALRPADIELVRIDVPPECECDDE
jgi:hypothetical protein